jgi:hypothetical protein
MNSDHPVRDMIHELGSEVCRCGAPKRSKRSFCRQCYYRLPLVLQTRLYCRVGHGYEEAYQEAIKILGLEASPCS